MEKTLTQKEVVDFVYELDYKKLHAGINDLLFDSRDILMDNKISEVLDFQVYTFENFKTQLKPRIEILLVANIMEFETGKEIQKIIYSSNSFGFVYKTNDYKVDSRFGIRFCMIKFLIEVTRENLLDYLKHYSIPSQFKGDDGEDIRLHRIEELTLNTYENLK